MHGLLGPGLRMLGIVHDDPDVTPPDKIRYDAAIALNRPLEPQGEFGVSSHIAARTTAWAKRTRGFTAPGCRAPAAKSATSRRSRNT